MLMFFHGLESGPVGRKSEALRAHFGEVEAPDFRGLSDAGLRLARAVDATDGRRGVIVGSSFGGLVAALLANAHPERVSGLVLMAPAVYPEFTRRIARLPENTQIIHGVQDSVVPFSVGETLAHEHGLRLYAPDDDHRLANSLELMIEVVQAVVDAADRG